MPNKKILLVDSMDLALQVEEEILRRSGLDILTARSGTEALALVREHKPDLVLLESSMPEMSGDACCKVMKADPELRKIPVIIMLTEPTQQAIDQCYEANCEEILTKPLDQVVVLEKITNLLEIKTRKIPRLNLKTSVQVERTGISEVVESINLNRQGILIASATEFGTQDNYRLTFAVSPADQNISLWARLERQLAPGSEKNPGTTYLVLFRFLSVPKNTADRIDQLATFQTQQAGKSAEAIASDNRIAGLQKSLRQPPEFYAGALDSLIRNLDSPISGMGDKELGAMRVVIATMKPWEKASLKGKNPGSDAIAKSLQLRLQLAANLKALEAFPQLSGNEQQALRGLQAEYFKYSDQILDLLQDRINAHMQSGELDAMKELNQSKTETFRHVVALKSLMNRILDPKAAMEASQFQYQSQEEDGYKVSAFNRPKPIEQAAPKKEEYVFEKKKEGSKTGKIVVLILSLIGAVVAVLYAMYGPPPGYKSMEAPNVTVKFETPIPYVKIKNSEGLLTITLKPEWSNLPKDQQQQLAEALYKEIRAKGFLAFRFADQYGNGLGYATNKGVIKLQP